MNAFPTGLTLARVLAAVRWLNGVWILGIVVVADNQQRLMPVGDDPSGVGTAFREPGVAWICALAYLALCAWGTVQVRRGADVGLTRTFALVEGAGALALSALDGWVFDPGHVFETSQSLAAQAPLIAAASIGLSLGIVPAAFYGVTVGPFEWWAARLNDFGPLELRHNTSILASSLFFAIVGAIFGWFTDLLRRAERTIADQNARNEVAGVMHDTVLQTFAVVEQRTAATDPELAASVRRADRDLRNFLFGAAARVDRDDADLETAVRRAVERAVADRDVAVTTNVVDLGHAADERSIRALVGAVGEAVTNAAKHAEASSIVVFVETDDDGGVAASIRDDGIGFDPDAVDADRQGIAGSIRRRIAAVDGRSEIESRPGAGTDVRIWVR